MKKILCLIDGLNQGGAERQMIGLASLLEKKGYIVYLLSYHGKGFYYEHAKQSCSNCYVMDERGGKLSKILAIRDFINQQDGFDWVIAYKDRANIVACILKLLGGKFNLIVSDRYVTQDKHKNVKLKYFLYRWADYVIPNANAQAQFIKENFPCLQDKTLAINNFTDTDYFSPSASCHVGDKLNVLTVARISPAKNILLYLEVIKKLKDINAKIHFDWVGRDFKGVAEQAKKKITDLGIEDYITIHPATSDIIGYYRSCDAFCLPSLYEGFPNVVCEAMSCGKPVLCSDVCDNALIVKNGYNAILFDPNNVDDMFTAFMKILSIKKDELLEWGTRSRDMAVVKFSQQSFVDNYIRLIESK